MAMMITTALDAGTVARTRAFGWKNGAACGKDRYRHPTGCDARLVRLNRLPLLDVIT